MPKKEHYRKVCQQYGLCLVIQGVRWKVVDPEGTILSPDTFPPYVRGFIDGYVEAMQRYALAVDVAFKRGAGRVVHVQERAHAGT